MGRHSLSCCLVVRNEEKQIKSCLDRIDILADEIVIVDTGSTDKTCDIIIWWIKQKKAENNVKLIKVDNKFHDSDNDFNFGAAKTFAFQNATKDFVMWLDAADTVTDQKKIKLTFLQETSKDPNCYFVLPTALSKKFAFNRTRIGPRQYAVMNGKIHETMLFTLDTLKRVFIPVLIKNFKKNRDLDRNLRTLHKDWDEHKSGRTCFYLGNTYREKGDIENAIKWFRKRVYEFDFKNDFKEEHVKALESIAEIMVANSNMKGISIADLYDIAQEMIKKEPDRVEGHYYLAKFYIEKRDWQKAMEELIICKKCKKPSFFKLWLNPNIYSGELIIRAIETCKTGLKYSTVLQPESITDYKTSQSTYRIGGNQYY
jgi:glycosyltransferase involved in cell wall biosynthesis